MKAKTIFAALAAVALAAIGSTQISRAQGSASGDQAAAAARGAKAWADNCASCHNARSPLDYGDGQWAVATAHMRVRANLPGNVARDILVFLQAGNRDLGAPLSGSVPTPGAIPAASAAHAAADPARGARVYGETCVACHGVNGAGAMEGVPPMSGPGGRLAKPDDQLLQHIVDGFQSPGSPMPMPARGGNPDLTDQELADALAYMREKFGR